MAIELALTPDSRWEAPLPELIRLASDAGFDAVGLPIAGATAEAAEALREAGIGCHELLANVLGPDEEAVIATARAAAAAAETVGASWVLTTFRAPVDERFLRLVREVAAIYADGGARLAAEFSPFGTRRSIADALEVVDAAGGPDRAGVLIDSWHFFRGDSSWEQLETIPLEAVAYLQFQDALPLESDDLMHETLNRRALPGRGELDLERFAAVLRDRGWEGVVSPELLSEELRARPLAELLREAHETTAAYWR